MHWHVYVECTRIDCVCVCTFHDTLTCFYCLSLPTKATIQVYVCGSKSSAVFRCKLSTIISSIYYTVRRVLHLLKYLYTRCVLLVCACMFLFSLSLCPHLSVRIIHVSVCFRLFLSHFSSRNYCTRTDLYVIYTCEWVHVCVYGYGYVYSCFLISSSSLSSSLLFLLFFFTLVHSIFLSCQKTHDLHAKLLNVHELKCILHKWNSKVYTNLKISCCARNVIYLFVYYLTVRRATLGI